MKQLPYLESLTATWQLIRAQGPYWLMAGCFTLTFCFCICPTDQNLSDLANKTHEQRGEILSVIKKIEHLQAKINFGLEKNEFFMERLIREEFNLKRISSPSKL
jgi:hypothetical protein